MLHPDTTLPTAPTTTEAHITTPARRELLTTATQQSTRWLRLLGSLRSVASTARHMLSLQLEPPYHLKHSHFTEEGKPLDGMAAPTHSTSQPGAAAPCARDAPPPAATAQQLPSSTSGSTTAQGGGVQGAVAGDDAGGGVQQGGWPLEGCQSVALLKGIEQHLMTVQEELGLKTGKVLEAVEGLGACGAGPGETEGAAVESVGVMLAHLLSLADTLLPGVQTLAGISGQAAEGSGCVGPVRAVQAVVQYVEGLQQAVRQLVQGGGAIGSHEVVVGDAAAAGAGQGAAESAAAAVAISSTPGSSLWAVQPVVQVRRDHRHASTQGWLVSQSAETLRPCTVMEGKLTLACSSRQAMAG